MLSFANARVVEMLRLLRLRATSATPRLVTSELQRLDGSRRGRQGMNTCGVDQGSATWLTN
jgi:hypothetical protein